MKTSTQSDMKPSCPVEPQTQERLRRGSDLPRQVKDELARRMRHTFRMAHEDASLTVQFRVSRRMRLVDGTGSVTCRDIVAKNETKGGVSAFVHLVEWHLSVDIDP